MFQEIKFLMKSSPIGTNHTNFVIRREKLTKWAYTPVKAGFV